ncbi:MAG: Calx-beta domain-containing protein [Reyranellaceae bacterium]
MVLYTAILRGGGRWHDGSGTITYSFPTKVPGYYPQVDYDGHPGNDAVQILEFNKGVVDEIVPLDATVLLNPAQQAAAIRAVNAWNEIASINAVKVGVGGGTGPGTKVTGDGTLVGGLGGATGFGENTLARGDDSPNPQVNIDSVFANGLNFFGTTYHDLFVNLNGSVSFGSAVSTFTPSTITGGGTPLIAPFWADVDTRLDTSDPVNNPPQVVYDLDTINHVFTATWPGVDYYSVPDASHVPKANFFQVQLYDRGAGKGATGDDFDIVFRYQQVQWTAGDASGGKSGLGGTTAHAGWTSGTGKFEEVPASGLESAMLNLPATPGNTGVNGLWVYQVRAGAVVSSDIIFGAFSAYSTDGTDDFGIAGLPPGTPGAPVLSTYPGAVVQSKLLGENAQAPLGATIGTPSPHGDIWVNDNGGQGIIDPGLQDYGAFTFLHEFGHAIGLDHPNGDGNDKGYSQHDTVMSYRLIPDESGIDLKAGIYPITPMLLDIKAAWALYGPNLDTRTEDDTYFGPAVAGTTRIYPFGDHADTILTIWDAGGTDTISAYGQSDEASIDLNPEHYSTVGRLQDNIGLAPLWVDGKTGIEYGWIENAIGGNAIDVLRGNDRANDLDGGPGTDTMIGQKGDDTYHVDETFDAIVELPDEGTDQVFSTATFTLPAYVENLTLQGTKAIDGFGNDLGNIIIGNSAANRLDGKAGADTLDGGDGPDTYVIDNPGDTIVYVNEKAGPDIDTVETSITLILPGSKLLGVGFIENLTLIGSDPINGYGNDFDNVIIGNSANNTIDGQLGNDTMIGGAGDDVYGVDVPGDSVTENLNEGIDTVVAWFDYTLGPNVEDLSLTSTAVRGTGNELDNLIYGQFNDNTGNILDGKTGIDTMRGFGGDDTYYVDNARDVVIEDLPGTNVGGAIVTGGGFDTVFSSVTYALPANVEALYLVGPQAIAGYGNGGQNLIVGNEFANILDGGGDADTLIGGAGNDSYVVDNPGDRITEVVGEGADSVYSFISYVLADNIENLQLLGAADLFGVGNGVANILIGNDGGNVLDGQGGDDYIVGGLGNDVLKGGVGNDVLDGGAGTDTADYSGAPAAVTVDLVTGVAVGEGIDTLLNVESVVGTKFGDVIRRGVGAGTLDGGLGNDVILSAGGSGTLLGGADIDTLSFAAAASAVTLSLAAGTATVAGSTATVSGFEVAIGSAFADALTGSSNGEHIEGGGGNDTIDGRDGADVIVGGPGDDMLTGGAGDDLFVYAADGVDTIMDFVAGQGTVDRIQVNQGFATFAELLVATKQVGLNSEIDFGGGNKLVLAGVDMSKLHQDDFNLPVGNLIVGTAGDDIIDGIVSPAGQPKASANADVVLGNGGNDTIKSLDGDDVVDGGDGDDTIDAGNGGDTVRGGNGNDTIVGSADGGNDSYDGGAGTDTASYAAVAVGLLVDLSTGSASAIGPQIGVDTLISIEAVIGGSGDDGLYGDAGANRLDGDIGNDTLDGRAGADALVGGAGADTIVFSTGYGADIVTDFTPGTDKVNLSLVPALVDLAAVLGKASQVGKDTVIDLGNGDMLTLQNVDKGSLAAGDFGFASTAPPMFSIAPLNANKNEGNSGTTSFTFTVTRAGDTTGAAAVDWSVAPATSVSADKSDFSGGALPGGTVIFGAGEISHVIDIGVRGDTVDEGVESFVVTLANAIGASIDSSHAGTTGIIANDDGPAILSIAALNAIRDEGNGGLTGFTFMVTRTGRTDVAASASWAVTGSGANPGNAADFAGALPSGGVSFAANETSKTVTVNVSGDTVVEANETFTVTLSGASSGATIGTATAGGTIQNDDRSTVSIAALSAVKLEGSSGSTAYTFTVSLSQPPVAAQSVDWSVTGASASPANGADFAGGALPAGTVTFAAGETSKVLTVNVVGDAAIEADEGFIVTLANVSSGLTMGIASAAGTIQTDDSVVTAHDDAYTIQQNLTLNVAATTGVLANDQGATSASVLVGPAHGALQLAGNGGFTYTPIFGYFGVDSFTYHAAAGAGGGQDGQATIYVVPVLSGGPSTTLNLLALNAEEQIASTYAAFFGRGADSSGFVFWVNQFNINLPTQGGAALFANIASAFGVSDEARALYPFLAHPQGSSDSQIASFIDSVYNNLFNRGSDAAGLAYWTGQVKATLAAGQFVGSVLINIMSGAQDTPEGKDITTLMGKVAVSLAYVHEQQEHHTTWLGTSDNVAATSLLHAVTSDPTTVLAGIKNAEVLIAAHP